MTEDERLVLFDFLTRVMGDEQAAGLQHVVRHVAELWALNTLLCELEGTLSAVLSPEYTALVGDARARLAAKYGRWPK